MNLWECRHPGCTVTATGNGGAIGLRAIGWYFTGEPNLYCPSHWPAKHAGCGRLPQVDGSPPDLENCSLCASDQEAAQWQALIAAPQLFPYCPAASPTRYNVLHTWESAPSTAKQPRCSVQLVADLSTVPPGADAEQAFKFYLVTDHTTGHWMNLQLDSALAMFAALAETSDWLQYVMGPFYRQMRRELLKGIAGEPTQEGRTLFEGRAPPPPRRAE